METNELMKAPSGCVDELKAKNEELLVVSHDLRSSLGVIQMSLDQMMMKETIRECETFIGMIARHTAMALQIVNDIMDGDVFRGGIFSIHTSDNDLVEIVKDCVSGVQLLASTHRISIEELLPESAMVTVDRCKISRAVTNLLMNAIKFAPPDSRIEISLRHTDGQIECVVEDAGPGVPLEIRDTIFDKFHQGKVDPRGIGLGLYISKSIIEGHKGKIWVDEAASKGAAFHFMIPKL